MDKDNQDIEDAIDEAGFGAVEKNEDSEGIGNEASNSVNIRVYIDRFGVQFTHRRNSVMGVIKTAKLVIKTAMENGWKPSWKNDSSDLSDTPTAPEQTFGIGTPASGMTKLCPLHGVTMEQKYSKAKGKMYFAHYDMNHKPCFGKGFMS
jgi:hypothetical protein